MVLQILEYFMDVMMKPGFLFVQRLQLNVEFLALLVALQNNIPLRSIWANFDDGQNLNFACVLCALQAVGTKAPGARRVPRV